MKQLKREATRPPRAAARRTAPRGAGIGTTAVALHVAATLHARFPDGRFYVDLRDTAEGHGPSPSTVLLRLLRQMGVTQERMPPSASGRERLYRQLTAGRRALVVVDHASSVAQVRGLVPATPDVFLLVVVSGRPFVLEAERVSVPPLDDRYAMRMMRNVAGQEAVARAKARMPRLLERCAGNAFALKAEATRLMTEETTMDPRPEGRHTIRCATPPGAPATASGRRRRGSSD
ncbi:hypothetical protein NKH77_19105 [Streptomyces sp. M19]